MKKKNILIIVAIIAGLGIIGGGYGFYLFFKTHKDLATVDPDFRLPAATLSNEFENDEGAASKKYIDKVVEITGLVSEVALGSDSIVNVTLSQPDALSGVICSFQGRSIDDVKVKKGDIATIRGECSGVLLDVLLNNCVLIDKKSNPK